MGLSKGQQKQFLKIQTEELKSTAIDYYVKEDGSEVLWLLCSFYHDPLQS